MLSICYQFVITSLLSIKDSRDILISVNYTINLYIFVTDLVDNHIIFPYRIFIICPKADPFGEIRPHSQKHLKIFKFAIFFQLLPLILNCFCYFYYIQKAVKFNVDFYSFYFIISIYFYRNLFQILRKNRLQFFISFQKFILFFIFNFCS